MRKPEQRLWDRMREALDNKLRLERIENVVGVGTADVFSLANGRVTPVELKAVEGYPARAATRVLGDKGLSREQRNWHLSWRQHGGESLILIGVGSRDLFAVSGLHADEVNDMNAEELAQHSVAQTWQQLFIALGGKR